MKYIDSLLDRTTMYRLVLYVLTGQIAMATILAFFNLLHFSPLALLVSTAFLVVICWAMNTICAHLFQVPTNIESAFITALILALILDPAQSPGDLQLLGWAAILAMASKYLLAIKREKLVFIAGGIGITPFRSMLKYLLDTQQRRDIVLIYANKTAEEIVYRDILDAAHARLGVKTLYTLTDQAAVSGNWTGLRGRINEQMILRAIPDYDERTYYLSGPPEMVRASEQVLKNMRISGYQIKKDFFPGLV